MLFKTLDAVDVMMKYVALRGWVGLPPAYQHLPAGNKEHIHCGEVGCLWDMLIYRYDTLHYTEIMLSTVNDADLKLILESGANAISKQITRLEKELVSFGVPVPRRPADVTVSLNNKDLWEDSHIYRMTLMGMQGAGSLHVRTFKKISQNHRLRTFFKNLLKEEVEKIDSYIRYGKVKGWLHDVPAYGP